MGETMGNIKTNLENKIPHLIIITLVIFFVIAFFAKSIFYTIHSGKAGVLYLRFGGGTVTERVYGEGMHIIFPWDKMTIYNIRTNYDNLDQLDAAI